MVRKIGQGTAIAPGLIARVSQGLKYVVTGSSDFFGPQTPMAPQAPADQAGRQFDYPMGINLNAKPRSEAPISFEQLRSFADSYDLMRLVIETRKDQLARGKWAIQNRDEHKKKDKDEDISKISDFFNYPDQEHDWDTWMRMLVEDNLVIDAATIYPHKSIAGKIYAFEPVDGATIKRVLDDHGRTPLPPDPAYQQIIKGLPATDYKRDELLYLPRNVRTNRIYGYPPVEQVIMSTTIALRRQLHQKEYYTEGTVPDALCGVPDTWTAEQIVHFQTMFDAMLNSESGNRRKMIFLPGTVAKGLVQTKEAALKDEYDEWLARIMCYAFNVSNQWAVKQMNRATSDTAAEMAEQEGLAPIQGWVKSFMDRILRQFFNRPDLEFVWVEDKATAPETEATINQTKVRNAAKTINEWRADDGLDPIEGGDVPLIFTATGAVRLEDVIKPPVNPMTAHNGGPPLNNREGAKQPQSPFLQTNPLHKADTEIPQTGITSPYLEPLISMWTDFLKRQAIVAVDRITKGFKPLSKVDESDPEPPPPDHPDLAHQAVDQSQWQAQVNATAPIIRQTLNDGLAETVNEGVPEMVAEGATETIKENVAEAVSSALSPPVIDRKALAAALSMKNPEAVAWAESHAAELVEGITETTRASLRSLIATAKDQGWTINVLSKKIADDYAFSEARATTIAQTEIAMANGQSKLIRMQAFEKKFGIKSYKRWRLSPYEQNCSVCKTNALDGAILVDQEFSSGHMTTPAHPNCECIIVDAIPPETGMAKYNQNHGFHGHFAAAPDGRGSGDSAPPLKRFAKYRNALARFVTETLHIKNRIHPHIFGTVGNVAAIKKRTGHNVENHKLVVENTALSHALKQHGDPATEAKRGQVAIDKTDFKHIPEIMMTGEPSSFLNNKGGLAQVDFSKAIDGMRYTVGTQLRPSAREVAFNTMWKKRI